MVKNKIIYWETKTYHYRTFQTDMPFYKYNFLSWLKNVDNLCEYIPSLLMAMICYIPITLFDILKSIKIHRI